MSSSEGSSVTFRRTPIDVRPRAIQVFARKLERDVSHGRTFDTLITGDAELRRLNREFRGKDYATDVLSFRSGAAPRITLAHARGSDRFVATSRASAVAAGIGAARVSKRYAGEVAPPISSLGDLAISAARARAQARDFGHSTEDEIRILMLHGLLHLIGMDHESGAGAMARAEKRWRARLKLPKGLIERTQS